MTLKSPQRRNLKSQAQTLKPIIQIGKNGVTEAQIQTIEQDLENHELIKIKFNDYKKQRKELSKKIINDTSSQLVELIGNTLIIYKQNENPSKRKISL
jgi:RNA-binding protein